MLLRPFRRLARLRPAQKMPGWKICAVALAATAAGTLLRFGFYHSLNIWLPFLFYFPAVMAAAWYGGFRAGVLTAAFSMAALVTLRVMPWEFTLSMSVSMGLFVVCALFISALCGQLHLARAGLENEKERYRITLGSIADGVIATDAQGMVTLINSEAQRLTGWSAATAPGQPLDTIFRIIDEQTREPLENPAGRVLRTWESSGSRDHTVLLRLDGREFLVEIQATPLFGKNPGSGLDGVVLVFRDVTESQRQTRLLQTHAKEMEERVEERTAHLRQALTDMESFSYSVSHDLRAPLRAIRSYVEVLRDDHGSQFQGEARDYLVRIQRSAERLERLTSDLLEYARLSATPVQNKPIDLGSTLREVLGNIHSIEEGKAEVRLEGPFPTVLGHDTLLQQVLRNLIDNAVKFVPAGRTPQLRIYATSSGCNVCLHVADNGIGIALDDQKRIFRMFERLDPARYPGTGMGLAMAQRAMQKQHGRISFESAPGQGSTFSIELDRCNAPAQRAAVLSVA